MVEVTRNKPEQPDESLRMKMGMIAQQAVDEGYVVIGSQTRGEVGKIILRKSFTGKGPEVIVLTVSAKGTERDKIAEARLETLRDQPRSGFQEDLF